MKLNSIYKKIKLPIIIVALIAVTIWQSVVVKKSILIWHYNHPQLPKNKIGIVSTNDNFIIKNWSILGPFRDSVQGQEATDKYKDIEKWGVIENNHTKKDLTRLLKRIKQNEIQGVSLTDFSSKVESINLYSLYNNPDLSDITNAYLTCEIISSVEQEVFLLSSCSFGSDIWVNNEHICSVRHKLFLDKIYEEFIRIKLKKGSNLVLAKVNSRKTQGFINWKFAMSIAGKEYSESNFKVRYIKDFIHPNFVEDTLKCYLGPYKYNLPISYSIRNRNNEIILIDTILRLNTTFYYNQDSTYQVNVKQLKENEYYFMELLLGDEKFSQVFYKGSLENAKVLIDSVHNTLPNIKTSSIQYKVNKERFDFLYDYFWVDMKRCNYPEIFPFQLRKQNRSRLYALIELKDMMEENEKNKWATMKLNGFFSQIDNSIQTYMSYIPSNLQNEASIPTMVLIPFDTNNYLKLSESWYSTFLDRFELDMKLAEKHGYALVYPWLRGGDRRDDPVSYADLFEVLSDFTSKHKNIDPNRFFLAGNCKGGERAFSIATKFPDRFAGLWLYCPSVKDYKKDDSRMNKNNESISFTKNLINIPIYIYTSMDDEEVPFDMVNQYISEAKKDSLNLKATILHNVSHYEYPKNLYDEALGFYKNYSINKNPEKIYYKTSCLKYNKSFWLEILQRESDSISIIDGKMSDSSKIEIKTQNISKLLINKKYLPHKLSLNGEVIINKLKITPSIQNDSILIFVLPNAIEGLHKTSIIEGPINHLFASNFVVVKNECDYSDSMAAKINEQWKCKTASHCIIKDDNQIKINDINNSNLILIGDDYQNKLLKKLLVQVPFTIISNALGISNQKFKDGNYHYCFIYPNPLNGKKYVLILGGNIKQFEKSEFNFLDAMNDVYVFDRNHVCVYSGDFEQNWTLH